jgi:hypothetical protein
LAVGRRTDMALGHRLIVLAAGAVVLLEVFARFVIERIGTPAPVSATAHQPTCGAHGMMDSDYETAA